MNSYIPIGKSRFIKYLDKIREIVDKAATAENPAQFIFDENMRTPLFMLEGLSRLYKKITDHKKLKNLNDLFKDMEDRLGQIDFYDGFYKVFVNDKNIPDSIVNYVKVRKEKKLDDFNKFLKKEKWISKNQKGLLEITKCLDQVKWLDEKNDTIAILDVYQQDIKKLIKKYKRKNFEFENIEKDVHELRRELRWLSIYPQALNGLIQLKEEGEPPEFLHKYLSQEIINSPYNVMPDGSQLQYHIMLHKEYFYALSWIIAQLGILKDSGLRIKILEESIADVYKTKEDVEQLVYSICDESQNKIPEILKKAGDLSTTFFSENILENLIA